MHILIPRILRLSIRAHRRASPCKLVWGIAEPHRLRASKPSTEVAAAAEVQKRRFQGAEAPQVAKLIPNSKPGTPTSPCCSWVRQGVVYLWGALRKVTGACVAWRHATTQTDKVLLRSKPGFGRVWGLEVRRFEATGPVGGI